MSEKISPIDWRKLLRKIKNGEVKIGEPIVQREGKPEGFHAIKAHGRGKYKKGR
jgi:hypothetical protein